MTPETHTLLMTAYRENRLAALHIDLQCDFHISSNFYEVVRQTANLADTLRTHKTENIWMAYPYQKSGAYQPSMTVKSFNKAAEDIKMWGDQIVKDVRAENHETLLVKNTPNAFGYGEKALVGHLKKHGLNTLIITGVQATCCVEDTLRSGLLSEHMNFVIAADCVNIPADIDDYRDYILDGRRHLSGAMEQRLHLAGSAQIAEVIATAGCPQRRDCNLNVRGL